MTREERLRRKADYKGPRYDVLGGDEDMKREDVRSWLSTDETGVLRWRKSPRFNVKKGTVAGCARRNGYLQVRLMGRSYLAHRLVWLLFHGNWPDGQIDHINGARQDNRPSNLRDVPIRGNHQNMSVHRTGRLVGTYLAKRGRWRARITNDGKSRHLGYYATEAEAHAAYMRAMSCDEPEKFHGRTP